MNSDRARGAGLCGVGRLRGDALLERSMIVIYVQVQAIEIDGCGLGGEVLVSRARYYTSF
jgi:hypothetical protein